MEDDSYYEIQREHLSNIEKQLLTIMWKMSAGDVDKSMLMDNIMPYVDSPRTDEGWLVRVLFNHCAMGYIALEKPKVGRLRRQSVRITHAGIRDAALLDFPIPWNEDRDSGTSPAQSTKHRDIESGPFESETWTGRPSPEVLDARRIVALQEGFKDADSKIAALNLSNQEVSQAKALISAMLILASAPEPPAKQINELMNMLAAISGVAGLFVSLIALFAK